ncbi:MAG TPA: ComEC/Rec2 family competence protein, partial [Bryobacteraceae bacterium]|nr:ComEC/Rec2 family competence protein [Bryobacteraceae bacterium]
MALPREPLLIPLAGVAAGILAAEYARFDWYELGWAVGGSLVLWLLALIKSKSLSKPTAFLLTVFVGIAASQVHRPAQPPQLDAQDDEVLIIGGCVVDPPTTTEPVARFALEIEPGAAVRVSLTARPGESLPPLSYGTKVEIEAKVRQPRNFQNPGSFDYASYLSRQRIFWTATARGVDKLTVLPGRCGSAWKAIWHNLRRGSLDRVRNLYPSDPYTVAMMSGLLVGDESSIQRTWAEAFRRTGTFHALVISGLHISVIA